MYVLVCAYIYLVIRINIVATYTERERCILVCVCMHEYNTYCVTLFLAIADKYTQFVSEHRSSISGAVSLEMLAVNAS